ncbi:hypothetical protein [Bacillus phage SBSphiJ6]|nr:hypothetical protein [Bacillus phage SBSphiJ6]
MEKVIDRLIEEHTRMKKPTQLVMSEPVHRELINSMHNLINTFKDKPIPRGYRLNEYKGLKVTVLERYDTVLLLG